MTVYCTNAPSSHETSHLPGFPAGLFSEQMVLLSEAAFFLTGGTVTAQQLSGPQGRCGTISGKSLLAGVKIYHSWGCCLLREQRPTGQKQSTAGWVQPFPATTHLNLQLIFKQYFAITKKFDECWLCLSTLPSCLSQQCYLIRQFLCMTMNNPFL